MPGSPSPTRVFLSYKRDDFDTHPEDMNIHQIRASLSKALSIRREAIFIDRDQLKPESGSPWLPPLVSHLLQSILFIGFLTPNYYPSGASHRTALEKLVTRIAGLITQGTWPLTENEPLRTALTEAYTFCNKNKCFCDFECQLAIELGVKVVLVPWTTTLDLSVLPSGYQQLQYLYDPEVTPITNLSLDETLLNLEAQFLRLKDNLTNASSVWDRCEARSTTERSNPEVLTGHGGGIAEDIIRRAIQTHSPLIPVLGPLCLRDEANYRPALDLLANKLAAIQRSLADDPEPPTKKPPLFDILMGVVTSRVPGGLHIELMKKVQGRDKTGSEVPACYQVTRLLASAIREMRALLGNAFRNKADGFTDYARFQVTLKHEEAKRLATLLGHIVEELAEDRHVDADCNSCDLPCSDRGIIRDFINLLVSTLQEKKQLKLTDCEWLSDLLWHYLRFGLPLRYEDEDLAYQASLLAKPVCYRPKVERLGTSSAHANAQRETAFLDYLRGWLTCKANQRGVDHDGYEDVTRICARLLAAQLSSRSYTDRPDQASFRAKTRSFTPYAMTSDLDKELESQLLGLCGGYCTLFPAAVRRPNDSESAGWLLRQTPKDAEGKTIAFLHVGAQETSRLSEAQYPIVVKLRGSPMEPLPREDEEIPFVDPDQKEAVQKGVWSHRIALTDFQLSEIWKNGSYLPGALSKSNGDLAPTILVVGMPVPDIYTHIELQQRAKEFKGTWVLVDISEFPHPLGKATIEMGLKIKVWQLELAKFKGQMLRWLHLDIKREDGK